MWRNLAWVLFLLGALLALPLLLRPREAAPAAAALTLVVVTPHNEAIRHEFGPAFSRWHQAHFGKAVVIDWRAPGGASDISRYLAGAYTALFRSAWQRSGRAWNAEAETAVLDRKLKPDATPTIRWAVRQEFLASTEGVGIDVVFGGGQFDLDRLALAGILVPSGFRSRHPELFAGAPPVIPGAIGGETWVDAKDRYVGVCLTSFGICYNPRRWAETVPAGTPPPAQWDDLGNPALAGQLGVGDPSKSGSVAKAFEMLIQQKMAEAVRRRAPADPAATAAALEEGWTESMRLIKEIGANARYFTHSAGKVPMDVAAGDAVAGMCIDFYGRFQAEWEAQDGAANALCYLTPAGGSSVSADPVGILRGAPHRELADRFLDFLLSPEGQRLWCRRTGAPDGPERYALRRLPIRRDLYTPAERAWMSDPAEDPFLLAQSFTYHPEWTAAAFQVLRPLLRVMIIDCHGELAEAWAAIRAAGGPAACPQAMAELDRLPFRHVDLPELGRKLQGNRDQVVATREWAAFFRDSYGRARKAAETNARTMPAGP